MTVLVAANLTLLSGAPEGVERLRSLIVELAVSGRLAPQESDDEPGALLATRLAASKAQALADSERRTKALDRPVLSTWPFEIPESWSWQVLDDLLQITGGVTLGRKLAGRVLVALPYLRVANVQRGYLTLDDLKNIEVPEDEVDKYLLQPGDLLITEGGDWDKVGRTAIWRGEVSLCLHQNHVFRARGCSDEFLPRWAELYLNSVSARSYFAGSSKQTTNLASINMTQLRSCAFPLPPLAEQHRIVAKVDELMALCDRLEARQQDAEAAHARLVQALLDSLTQARDVDEFRVCWQRVGGQFGEIFTTEASVLSLERALHTLALRDALTEGRTHDRSCAADDPHPIPESWAWRALADVTSVLTDGEHLTPQRTNDRSQIPLATAKNVRNGHIDLTDTDFVTTEVAERCWSRCKPAAGDVLMVSVGATLGRLSVLREQREMVIVRSVALFRPRGVDPDYLALALRSPQTQGEIWSRVRQSAQPCLYLSQARQLRIPVPPLERQLHIVAELNELLALCDQLKSRIAAARAKHAQLAEALVQQALSTRH